MNSQCGENFISSKISLSNDESAKLRSQVRHQIRTLRQAITELEQAVAAQKLLTQLCAQPKIQQANHIAIYLPRDGELDGLPFIKWCWQQQKSVYLPVIHPFTKGQLLFLKYQSNTPMHLSRYGINEPKLDVRLIKHVDEIDVILTPLVAFDSTGNRLGMGGGFYDRTLAHWYEKNKLLLNSNDKNNLSKPYPIGIAHDCQHVNNLPIQAWDIPLPEIITPTQKIII